MSTLASDPVWGWLVILFAVLALAMFLLATWSGRWGMWLAGYLFAILALAAAITVAQGRTTDKPEDGPRGAIAPRGSAARPAVAVARPSAGPRPGTGPGAVLRSEPGDPT